MELINNDDSTWTLFKVSELEHLMLTRLPESADSTGCEEASSRLFPSPIAPGSDLDKEKKSYAESQFEINRTNDIPKILTEDYINYLNKK